MYFIFIVNDFPIGDKLYKGKEIVDILIKNKHWVFNQASPNLSKISPGEEAVVYIAGKGNRLFYANLRITGDLKEINPNKLADEPFYNMFLTECPISTKNIWNSPLSITEVKDKLNFITDKKNYGLFLRQSNRIIEKSDYEYIVKMANKKNTI